MARLSNDSEFPNPSAPLELPEGACVHTLGPDLALLEIPVPRPPAIAVLTEAEQAIALAVFEGATNQEMARARAVGLKTVDKQLEAIYRKLGVSSRVELVLYLRHAACEEDDSLTTRDNP